MLLFLTGTSSVGKDALITEFLNRHPEWRYMAVDESVEAEFVPEDAAEGEEVTVDMTEFYVSLACQCAQELRKENIHLVASCAHIPLDLRTFVQEEMGEEYIAAHLGKEGGPLRGRSSFYHCVIDPSVKTLKQTLLMLDRLVGGRRK